VADPFVATFAVNRSKVHRSRRQLKMRHGFQISLSSILEQAVQAASARSCGAADT
jgi:hypothetical protein